MPTAYVYAPIGGTITGRGNYCGVPCDNDPCGGDHGAHSTCKGWLSPIDIGGTGDINLYVNYPTINGIFTLVEYECCNNDQNNYGRAITVELYSGETYVGAVMYGHVANPTVTHNRFYALTSNSKKLGTVVGGVFGTCYTGAHVHLERSGGVTQAPCCCATATRGTTILYRWVF